jgi:hypothetical protein
MQQLCSKLLAYNTVNVVQVHLFFQNEPNPNAHPIKVQPQTPRLQSTSIFAKISGGEN